jgi:hypothetical protein
MTLPRRVGLAMACLVLAGAAASGCISGPLVATQTTLEKDIADLLREDEEGLQLDSVKCPGDLVGEVGESIRCEVEARPAHFLLTPIVTVTGVEDGVVKWRIEPALSQQQLERRLTEELPERPVDSVSCRDGLEPEVGTSTLCDVTVGGVPMRRTVKLMEVENLSLNFRVLSVIPRAVLAQQLLDELARSHGITIDTADATCAEDLQGVVGATAKCTVVDGPDRADFLLRANALHGNNLIEWSYEPTG